MPKDELAFVKGILSYSVGGKCLPSKMGPVYDYVRPIFEREFRNSQLYTKFQQGRINFKLITTKIEVNNHNFQKNKYEFDSLHQAALYDIWMQMWGEEYSGGDEHANYAEAGKEEARNASSNFNEPLSSR